MGDLRKWTIPLVSMSPRCPVCSQGLMFESLLPSCDSLSCTPFLTLVALSYSSCSFQKHTRSRAGRATATATPCRLNSHWQLRAAHFRTLNLKPHVSCLISCSCSCSCRSWISGTRTESARARSVVPPRAPESPQVTRHAGPDGQTLPGLREPRYR